MTIAVLFNQPRELVEESEVSIVLSTLQQAVVDAFKNLGLKIVDQSEQTLIIRQPIMGGKMIETSHRVSRVNLQDSKSQIDIAIEMQNDGIERVGVMLVDDESTDSEFALFSTATVERVSMRPNIKWMTSLLKQWCDAHDISL